MRPCTILIFVRQELGLREADMSQMPFASSDIFPALELLLAL